MTLEEYRKSEPLKSCYLTKDDLQQLVRLITNQVPPIDVRISAQISTSRKIESQSLDVFLAHPDLPPILSELDISTFDRVQSITIRIGGPLSMYAVRGRDEVWVLGNFQRLQEFFRNHQGFIAPEWLRSPILLSLLIGGAITLVAQLFLQQQLLYGFIASVASALVLVRYCQWAFIPLNNIGRIVLVQTRSRWRTLLSVENISLLIAFLSLIAAIIPLFR